MEAIAIRAFENISDRKSVKALWNALSSETQITVAKNATLKARQNILPGIFLSASLNILELLVTSDVIDANLTWNYIVSTDDDHWADEDSPFEAEYQQFHTHDVRIAEKPLIVVAMEKERYDLIEFLVKKNGNIPPSVLEVMGKERDMIKIVIDHIDIDDRTAMISLISVLSPEDIALLVAKGAFVGYELKDFEEMDLNGPIELAVCDRDLQKIKALVSLGLKISPDATWYFEAWPHYFENNSELIELFVEHGGDRSVLTSP